MMADVEGSHEYYVKTLQESFGKKSIVGTQT